MERDTKLVGSKISDTKTFETNWLQQDNSYHTYMG